MFKISEKCHIFIALRLGKGYCLNLESFASTISILSQYHNLISINTMVSLFTLFVLINVVSCLYGETSTAIGSTSLTEYWKRLFNVVSNNVRKSPGNIAASSVTTLIQGDPKLASTLNEHSSFLGKETPGITPILQEEKLQADEESDPDPTQEPTTEPTTEPSPLPTEEPSVSPTEEPTLFPTEAPTEEPTPAPSAAPTAEPTAEPSSPTADPTIQPTATPSSPPTIAPTGPSYAPTAAPSAPPTLHPTPQPSRKPSCRPTRLPSAKPTLAPTIKPTFAPSAPTAFPTLSPTFAPTLQVNALEFDSVFTFNLTTATLSTADQKVVCFSTGSSMGINTSWVRFQSQEIENSRLIGANTVQASTTKSLFNIQYFIIYARVTTRFPLTGAVTPAQVYAILIGNLDAAMTSGNYVNYLQSYAVTLNTGTATFTDITQEDVRVTNEALILYGDPTATPTLSPTYVKPHRLPNPELIGTVLGVFFGSIMIAIILYFAILSVRANRRDEALITAPQSGTSNNSRATANNKTREEIYLPVEIDDDAPRGLGSVGKHMLRRDMALAAHNKAKTNVVQVVFENQQL